MLLSLFDIKAGPFQVFQAAIRSHSPLCRCHRHSEGPHSDDRVDNASTEIRVDIHPAPATLEEEQLDCLADLRLQCPVGLFWVTVFEYDDSESGERHWLHELKSARGARAIDDLCTAQVLDD